MSIFAQEPVKNPSFRTFDIPVKMGVLIGLIGIVISTFNFMVVLRSNFILFSVMWFVSLLVSAVLYGITGARQRKAMGGYINIREAFQAIFVAILISTLMSAIWGLIYAKWVDPGISERTKEATLAFMQRMKAPREKLDEAAANFDKQLKESLQIHNLVYNYAKSLIIYGIIGFICAAIVKREPRMEMR